MLCNIHTHSVFCDGENTPEELVLTALNKGFSTIGFSSHAFTDFGEPFGIDDIDGYLKEINRLKLKYNKDIQIYLGIEEDALSPIVNRNNFDFIIGSHHYIKTDDKILPIDLSYADFKMCASLFNNVTDFAENYYKTFCEYIKKYKPQIIAHFDLITKFDEQDNGFLLNNKGYNKVAESYLKSVINTDCLFEVNTGAIARGYRTSPYPAENLLYLIFKEGGRVIISSDCHEASKLDFYFEETKQLLKDIGFKDTYILYNDKFIKQELK